jgi:DNA/RNA-binding domain of Phe-tRNA-synthetase-like protein
MSLEICEGVVDDAVAAELPGMTIQWVDVPCGVGKTPSGLAQELALAGQRMRGATIVMASTGTVAAAYRSLARQLGMDPAAVAGSIEAVAMRRLLSGGLSPTGIPNDAATLATLEFGSPITVFDAGLLSGQLRISRAGADGLMHSGGDIVLADQEQVVGRLFVEPFPQFQASCKSKALRFAAVGAPEVAAGLCSAALQRAADLMFEQ